MKHIKRKTINILIIISIILVGLEYYCYTDYTMKNEYTPKQMLLKQYINFYYLNSHPKFDYFNGLWLMFGSILFFCIFCLLELPLKIEILKQEIKIDYYKKRIRKN